MRFWQRMIFYGIFIPSASLGLSFFTIKAIEWKAQSDIRKYVEKNIASLVEEQEQKVGVKQRRIPTFKYTFPERTKEQIGHYNEEEDTIDLYADCLLLKDPSLEEDLKKLTCEDTGNARDIILHELGHAYADALSEELTGKNWPIKRNETTNGEEDFCMRMTSEGIAEYFQRKTTGRDEKIMVDVIHNKEALVLALLKYRTVFYYEGGYQLVKPIIDTYGEMGIAYLITNPPTRISTLAEYQQQALQDLSQENSISAEKS